MSEPVFLAEPGGPWDRPAGSRAGGLLCDRDGTVIENRADYVRDPSHIRLFPQAVRALRQVCEQGVPVILITNQSPIGRGIMSLREVVALHRLVVDALTAAGAPIAGTYLCPHAPGDGCGCRKPEPGMVRAALDRYRLDPRRTALVGDSVEDMLAARRAGVHGLMVRTGRGAGHVPRLASGPETAGTPVVADLTAAVGRLGPLFEGTETCVRQPK